MSNRKKTVTKPKTTTKRKRTRKRFAPFKNQITVYEYLESIRYEVDEDNLDKFIRKFSKKLNYEIHYESDFKRFYELFETYGNTKCEYYLQNLDKLNLDTRNYININKFFDFRRKLENNVL